MKFYDRESEQQLLSAVLRQSKQEARMTVLMGRRRIGKTELSLRCGDDTVLYFFVGKKAEALLCQDFVQEITSKLGVPVLGQANSFSEVFRFVLHLSETRAFTLIIDEFQNFQKVNPTVFSNMQRDWDLNKSKSHLKEILHDFNPDYTPEDLLALFSITGGVAWYVTLLLDRGKTSWRKMLGALTEENSPFINEGKNILIEEFGTDYVIYFSILTCIAGGMKTSAEIKNELGIDNISSYLSRLEDYYGLITKYQPIFAKENSKKVRYQLDDCFLIFWFRFFFKYQALVENKALKALDTIIRRDYSGVSGLMMERYFVRKFQEQGQYVIGKWWDRKGFNEIDLVVVDPIGKEAWAYELKKDESRYDEESFKKKVDIMVQQTPELHKMKIHIGSLSKGDM